MADQQPISPQQVQLLEEQVRKLEQRLNEAEKINQWILMDKRALEVRFDISEKLARIGYWETNLQNQELHWSDGFREILGADKQLKPDMKLYKQMMTDEDGDRLGAAIQKVFINRENYSFEHSLLLANQQLKIVELTLKLVFDEQTSQPAKLLGIVQDITVRKESQAKLERLSLVAAKTSNAVFILDKDLKLEWMNDGYTRMTGYTYDDLQGKRLPEVLALCEGDLKNYDEFGDSLSSSQSVSKELEIKNRQGEVLWVLMNLTPTYDYALNLTNYVAIIINITKRKEAEKMLLDANNELKDKNHHITESINYAQRIQAAMLPNLNTVKQELPNLFVLFKPRDIVSGDFYWFAAPHQYDESGNSIPKHKLMIAAVDCTGHGVPGAFMSMIGHSLLDEIVNVRGTTKPDHILRDLHDGVRYALRQQDSHNRDGMDMTLVVVCKKKHVIEFAGAKNPLLYIQDNQLYQLKGDKLAIGGEQLEVERKYARHVIDISKPTTFYLYSDGYQDQFGGPEGKKFMRRNLRELLLRIHQKPMPEQRQILDDTIEKWREQANEKQVDDIMVIGAHWPGKQ
ncbi:PAS domain S-box protein [Microscilla marina]|uniref:histidine kinase n=1 Tax=Microscilla marina ATCC 23134 TaxID=313606 RepID=A1ZH58_MICM2|nr:PAS domain S-box protein [Microscilla marina]EAY30327.1 serine/threonine protein kinases [Microscilla marina ATCC 23134]